MQPGMRHAVMAQFHRWFLIYESSHIPIENALEMMDPNIRIHSQLGESRGHESYRQRLAALPGHWQNAHFVSHPSFELQGNGDIVLTAQVEYLNVGMRTDVTRRAKLRYRVELLQTNSLLPQLKSVSIEQLEDGTTDHFIDAYPLNRTMSVYEAMMAILVKGPGPNFDSLADAIFARAQDVDRLHQLGILQAGESRRSSGDSDLLELDLSTKSGPLTLVIRDRPDLRFGQIESLRFNS